MPRPEVRITATASPGVVFPSRCRPERNNPILGENADLCRKPQHHERQPEHRKGMSSILLIPLFECPSVR